MGLRVSRLRPLFTPSVTPRCLHKRRGASGLQECFTIRSEGRPHTIVQDYQTVRFLSTLCPILALPCESRYYGREKECGLAFGHGNNVKKVTAGYQIIWRTKVFGNRLLSLIVSRQRGGRDVRHQLPFLLPDECENGEEPPILHLPASSCWCSL